MSDNLILKDKPALVPSFPMTIEKAENGFMVKGQRKKEGEFVCVFLEIDKALLFIKDNI